MSAPRRQWLGFLALCVAIFLAALLWHRCQRVGPPTPPSPVAPDTGSFPGPAQPGVTTLPVAAELSAALRQESGTPEEELGAVGQLLYFYRQAFGENPVGDNADIVAALSGANAKETAWLPRDCPSVVGGSLVDRWGTPYWFHAESAREMEIRSAGPDRELFTGDDLTLP